MKTFISGLLAITGLAVLAFNSAYAQIKTVAPPTVTAAQETFSGDICGNQINLVLKTPGADANPELKKFFGVWGNGKWDNNACTGLAVTEINGNTATVLYIYGVGSNSPSSPAGSFVIQDATVVKGQLFFKSRKGYPVYYQLTSQGRLDGQFSSNLMKEHLQKLK